MTEKRPRLNDPEKPTEKNLPPHDDGLQATEREGNFDTILPDIQAYQESLDILLAGNSIEYSRWTEEIRRYYYDDDGEQRGSLPSDMVTHTSVCKSEGVARPGLTEAIKILDGLHTERRFFRDLNLGKCNWYEFKWKDFTTAHKKNFFARLLGECAAHDAKLVHASADPANQVVIDSAQKSVTALRNQVNQLVSDERQSNPEFDRLELIDQVQHYRLAEDPNWSIAKPYFHMFVNILPEGSGDRIDVGIKAFDVAFPKYGLARKRLEELRQAISFQKGILKSITHANNQQIRSELEAIQKQHAQACQDFAQWIKDEGNAKKEFENEGMTLEYVVDYEPLHERVMLIDGDGELRAPDAAVTKQVLWSVVNPEDCVVIVRQEPDGKVVQTIQKQPTEMSPAQTAKLAAIKQQWEQAYARARQARATSVTVVENKQTEPTYVKELDEAATATMIRQNHLYRAVAGHGLALATETNSQIDSKWLHQCQALAAKLQAIDNQHQLGQASTETDQATVIEAQSTLLQLFSRQKQFTAAMVQRYTGAIERWVRDWETLSKTILSNASAIAAVELGVSVSTLQQAVETSYLEQVRAGQQNISIDALIETAVDTSFA